MPPSEPRADSDKTVDTIMQAGQIVDGKYRVDHLLGQGGMAAVWAGTNERTGKRVALKVILRSLATTRGAEHLVYGEALAASRVNHPNVVTVFDVIEHEGMPCIVMELLDGESLSTYFARKGCLSVSEAMSLLLPAMRGVACANAQGVVHRDLKPQNIFLCIGPDGHILTTKVLDFGISVMMERVVDTSAGSTLALEMGTPAYMAPEHISGERRIDERADVYGFGVLLYEALSGQLPFPGEPGPDLFQRVLQEPAPPLTQFRRDLPLGLVRIIEAAMAKEPDHRYSDLNLMVSALENEVLLPTPVSRLITPLVGGPSFALHEALSGQFVAPVIPRAASRAHEETKMLFAFPLKKENEKRASNDRANCGLKDRSAEVRSPPATGRETVLLRLRRHVRGPFSRITSLSAFRARLVLFLRPRSLSALRAWSLFALRGRRGWVGGGIAVILVIAGWMATRAVGHALRTVPASVASIPRAVRPLGPPPAVPAAEPAAIVVPGTLPVLVAASPATPAPGTVADAGYRKPTGQVRVRGPLRARGLAGVRSRAPRSSASMKSAAPRAGKLSADDF
jgi:serine/threonine protein kinase